MFAEIVIVLPSTGLPFAYNWSVISVGLILCLFDSSSHTLVTVTFINFNVLITSNLYVVFSSIILFIDGVYATRYF